MNEADPDSLKDEDVSFLEPASGNVVDTINLIFRGLLQFGWPYLISSFLIIAGVCSAMHFANMDWASSILPMVLGLILLFLFIIWKIYRKLRTLEETDEPDHSLPDYQTLTKVMSLEDRYHNNHLTGVYEMKPQRIRQLLLRIVYWAIAKLATKQFRPGFLNQIGTIHFARWVLIPKSNTLLFFSNYSGSWESYLEDFITKAASGLTGVWSNTVGFPKTKNLINEGARDGDRFKRSARRTQRPSLFWFAAYPHLSTRLIRLNAAIITGLIHTDSEEDAYHWLELFGSRRRKPSSMETREIQSIVFGGMRKLQESSCVLLQLPESKDKARSWLKAISKDISYGEQPLTEKACILALTQTGLKKLGLKQHQLSEFPIAFQQGMTESFRAERILGDTGEDSPETWSWGYEDNSVDAALIIYARKDGMQSAINSLNLRTYGVKDIHTIETRCLPDQGPVREAFGFVDGVSQPIIKGTRKWYRNKTSQHIVEAGEFILGYPDNRGYLPTTPTIPATEDPNNHLPVFHQNSLDHDWPDFKEAREQTDKHDFGRNGSFLVIRQMKQHTKLFEDRISEKALEINDFKGIPESAKSNPDRLKIWLKAKLVGRWPDGTSLIKYPYEPGSGWDNAMEAMPPVQPDNDFLQGSDDPEGLRCPFSSHIRRTNPRDSFEPGSEEQLDIVNRHRILRMGRPYGPGHEKIGSSEEQGLLFMCLNADLQRQFEFIQQTWVKSKLFHGLSGEVDAVIGKGGKVTIPTPEGPIVVDDLKDYVQVRGGAYFFMPGRSAIRYLCHLED